MTDRLGHLLLVTLEPCSLRPFARLLGTHPPRRCPCASLFHLAVLVGHEGAALVLASLLGAQRLGLVGAHLRRRIVGAAMGRAHLARGHPDLGRASTRRERGNQRDPDDQSTIRHLTSPLRMGELPLRVSVSRDSIRQIFRSAEAGYNATLVPTVLGLGAPRRTHVGAVPYRIRCWVGSLRRYAKRKSHWSFVDGPRQTTAVSKAAAGRRLGTRRIRRGRAGPSASHRARHPGAQRQCLQRETAVP